MPLLDPLKNEDFLNSVIVEPGFYRVKIHDVEVLPSKDQQSTNYWIKGKILFNAETGDKKYEGVPTPYLWLINSKGAFAAIPLYKALGMELKPGMRLNTDFLIGKEVDMMITNSPDNNGVMRNSDGKMFRAPRQVEVKA